MADAAPLYLALTALLTSCATAAYAALHWRQASRATRAKKPSTPSLSESLETLNSELSAEKISHQLQKLENRLRMREVRDGKRMSSAPATGASKADLFRYYGFKKVGPAFAQHQLDIERHGTTNAKE